MLAGEVLKRRERIGRLGDEIADLEAKIAALDEAMQLADSRVDPTAAGVVRATSGRYRGRGSLTNYVLDQIVAAGDAGIDTLALCLMAMSYFEVPAESKADFLKFRAFSIGDALQRLARRGVIEHAPRPAGGTAPAVWFVKRYETLEQLASRTRKS